MLHYETTKGVAGSNLDIESPDGSVDVTREGEVVNLSIPLVTEEENGRARAFDKKVLDHSLHNVVQFGSHTDETEAVSELTSEDDMYTPRLGQMLDWKDSSGKYHLSRYSYNPDFTLPIGSQWSDCVYDPVHDTICVLSFGHSNGNMREGGFLCATRKIRGNWVVTDYGTDIYESHYESWFQLAYGNGMIVAMSGNSSREYAVSRDGGFTWEFGALPLDRYYMRVKYFNGAFFFVCPTGYFRSVDMTEFDDFVLKSDLLDITGRDGEVVFYTKGDSFYSYIDETNTGGTSHAMSNPNASLAFVRIEYLGEDKYLISSEFGSYYNDSTHGYRGWYGIADVSYDYVTEASKAMYITSSNPSQGVVFTTQGAQDGHVICYGYGQRWVVNTFLRRWDVDLSHDGASGSISEQYASVQSSYAMHVCIVRDQYLFCIAGTSRVDSNSSTNSAKTPVILDMASMTETTIDFSPWERLPQLSETNKGLVAVREGEVEDVVTDEDFLTLDGNTLKANASNRFTPYKNYKLTRGNASLWCESSRAEIVDGTTKVYSDEDCTTEAGTILSHNYNINNPNDVEVDIDGVSYVYIFHDSKTPVSLATTEAVIDSVENKLNYWVGSQAQYDTITHTNDTMYIII